MADAQVEIKMITANSRIRLTAEDFDFIVRALSIKESDRVSLASLLIDEGARDEILDHEVLAHAILESSDRLSISPQLMFYVLCRRVLRQTGARSREASDFVASMLEGFSKTSRVYGSDAGVNTAYLSDMMIALGKAGDSEAFLLRSHMANYALFVSGIFVENVEKRKERGAPDVAYYEKLGGMNYRVAAEYRDARKYHLSGIYEELSRSFHEVRIALNDLASRFLHLDSPALPIIAA
jgi:hypothetical protein